MRGDFSSFWNKEDKQNFNGVLHQQGRVLLDRDWNAQTEIFNDWQETAARDIIGAGVAAVPSDAPDSFKVTEAKIVSGEVEISVNKGRVWADGLLLNLGEADGLLLNPGENVVRREATYLQPPIQNPAGKVSALRKNMRDAVILETWLEELNAFQLPELLLEPALGGVDTTERVHTAFRFRLFRMDKDDTCDSIIRRLEDDFKNKGKLTVSLYPDETITGDCPVVKGGGYTGFEHELYRVEIAQTKDDKPYFKWSQFNGGLVGRGRFNSGKVTITANLNAILHSGLTDFYLETLEEVNGYWQVTYGAKATLDTGTGALNLSATEVFFGTAPDTKTVFFRLWNDIRPVAEFLADDHLQDGIRLKFETKEGDKYTAQDFWTFIVRAGEISNNQVLIENEPPEGIFYHRVSLAELFWDEKAPAESSADIEDCRRIFQPLTKLKTCCTYRVGDGVNSHGDFTSIQAAIDALPGRGGEICVLPGTFTGNIVLNQKHNRNIVIKGCGMRTRIVGVVDPKKPETPVIHVVGGINLRFESFSVLTTAEGVGILLEGDEIRAGRDSVNSLRNVKLEKLQITTAARSAIELHVGQFITVRDCKIFVKDVSTEYAAVMLAGDDLLFEENEIRVMSGRDTQWVKTDDPLQFEAAHEAAGGLHLSGGCMRVRVINNLIMGGTSNGINLGNVEEVTVQRKVVNKYAPWVNTIKYITPGKCYLHPVAVPGGTTQSGTIFKAGDALRDILIERNRILCMGRNGIGVDGFFGQGDFRQTNNNNELDEFEKLGLELLSVENLFIIGNTINRCLNRAPVDINPAMTDYMGYGGMAFSDVENLVVRDNFITDNGANYLNPTCGIFALHVTGGEISRNQIINNGRQTVAPVKNGKRGGIVIVMATQPTGAESTQINGSPALTVRDNVVSVPMGQALAAIAMGDVSVTGNRFLSQSIVPGTESVDYLASHILLFNLSVSMTFQAGRIRFSEMVEVRNNNNNQTPAGANQRVASTGQNVSASAAHDYVLSKLILKRGATLFAQNQCQVINQKGAQSDFSALSAIMIIGLDDVAFLGNQCGCILVNSRFLCNTLLIGGTTRANGNFWQEILDTVHLSAVTFGQELNTTTDNQSTHCVLARGGWYMDRYNLSYKDKLSIEHNSCRDLLGELFRGNG